MVYVSKIETRIQAQLEMGIKKCSQCKEDKPLRGFNKKSSHRDGLRSECRECQKRNATRYRYEYRDQLREKWTALNQDPKIKARKLQWARDHPELSREHNRRRRAQKRNSQVEPIKDNVVYELFDGICHLCDVEIDLSLKFPHPLSFTIDHVIPLAKGGPHTYENVAPAHLKCNIDKGAG